MKSVKKIFILLFLSFFSAIAANGKKDIPETYISDGYKEASINTDIINIKKQGDYYFVLIEYVEKHDSLRKYFFMIYYLHEKTLSAPIQKSACSCHRYR